MNRLVVVSNRVGPLGDDRKAGGLAVGIADAFRRRGGVWFGWSGKTSEEGTFGPLQIKAEGNVQLATVDMAPADIEEFYSGFSNQTLWPIFHYRIDLARFDRRAGERLRAGAGFGVPAKVQHDSAALVFKVNRIIPD